MSRNIVLLLIVAIVAVAGIGAYIYHEQNKNTVQITIGNQGVKIKGPSD
ncbi:hypothetical protein ACETRX_32135 [Labrys portucalensis]|uniref:Uncharacterized protein n=1 Tax=Labrys neptuniae TaxID=376174 RepID=A0ABV3PTM2_9HYPH|nr:hypothetical protein [Labrys neptuniae]MDT3379715.1 hypothetical protein [Labrys neptuniae]